MRRRILALVTALVGCTSNDPPPGQLMLAITSDLEPVKDIDRLFIEMKHPEGSILRHEQFDLGRPTGSTLPATLAITAATQPDSPLVIRVYAYASSPEDTYLLREVVTSIPLDRIALVRAPLEFLCFGSGWPLPAPQSYIESECENETTCQGGECRQPEIVQTDLPTYDEALVFGGGRCFDTLACFGEDAGGVRVAPPAGPCTIPIPSNLSVANVALVTNGYGACYKDGTCLVPLDPELPSGWRENGGVIELPPGVCNPPTWFGGRDNMTMPQIESIALTPACDRKVPELPVCGPSSAAGPGSDPEDPSVKPPLP